MTEVSKQRILQEIGLQYGIKVNFYESEVMPAVSDSLEKYGEDVVNLASHVYGGLEEKTMTYFDHKQPDGVSTINKAYSLGLVHNSRGRELSQDAGKEVSESHRMPISIPFIPRTRPPYK